MKKGLKIMLGLVFGILIISLVGFITMWLWNWLVPALFGGKVITFWQALGLFLLSKILFSGMGWKRWHDHQHHRLWKYREKFANMTPEERDLFRQRMKDRWCRKFPDDSGAKSGTSGQ